MDYQTYYAAIDKPFFAPEPWVFGLAWGTIYPLIALAFVYLVYFTFWKRRLPTSVLVLFAVNIAANVAFTPLQLNYPGQIYATLDILLVLGTLVALEYILWHRQKIVFLLLLPYLLWGAFATILQVTIYILNFT